MDIIIKHVKYNVCNIFMEIKKIWTDYTSLDFFCYQDFVKSVLKPLSMYFFYGNIRIGLYVNIDSLGSE